MNKNNEAQENTNAAGDDQKTQLDEMLADLGKTFSSDKDVEEEKTTEEEKHESKTDEEDSDDSEEKEGEEEEIPEEDEDGEDGEEEEEGEDKDEDLDDDSDDDDAEDDGDDDDGDGEEVDADDPVELKKRLSAVMTRLQEYESGDVSKPTKPEDTTKDIPIPTLAPTENMENLLGDLSLDDVLDDPKLFNQVLQNVAQQARAAQYQDSMRALPKVVMQMVKHQSQVDKLVEKFYEENDDLIEVRGTVGRLSNEISAENPDWTIAKIFKEAGKKTRKILGMPAQKKGSKKGGGKDSKKRTSRRQLRSRTSLKNARSGGSPGFAGNGKGKNRSPNKKVTEKGMDKEIGDMLSSLE